MSMSSGIPAAQFRTVLVQTVLIKTGINDLLPQAVKGGKMLKKGHWYPAQKIWHNETGCDISLWKQKIRIVTYHFAISGTDKQ